MVMLRSAGRLVPQARLRQFPRRSVPVVYLDNCNTICDVVTWLPPVRSAALVCSMAGNGEDAIKSVVRATDEPFAVLTSCALEFKDKNPRGLRPTTAPYSLPGPKE